MIVSVIIPIYNTASSIGAAIDSVLSQTYSDFEIICVNDGSPDNAAEVLSAYAARDSRIRVITQENKGLSAARNAGLGIAGGKYVLFLDSDDALPRYALELMIGTAEREKVAVVVSSCFITTLTYEEKQEAALQALPKEYQTYVSSNPIRDILRSRYMRSSAWNKLYRRDVISDRRFIEGIYFEDWPFITSLIASQSQIAIVNAPCYIYSKIGDSIIRSSFNEKKVMSYVSGIHAVASELYETPLGKFARKRCAMAASMMINKTAKSHNANLKKLCKEKFEELHHDGILRYHDLPIKSLLRLLLFA